MAKIRSTEMNGDDSMAPLVNRATLGGRGDAGIVTPRVRENLLVTGIAPIPPSPGSAGDQSWGATADTVIGNDDRIAVGDPSVHPWCMICDLEIYGNDGRKYVGTGWFASPTVVITAGHNVYHSKIGGQAARITVLPGRSPHRLAFGEQTSSLFAAPSKWIQNLSPEFDIAAIYLDQAFEPSPGWFSFSAFTDAELNGQLINVSGYPKNKGGDELWTHRNRVLRVSSDRIYYEVDSSPGQSGSPIYLFPDGLRQAPTVVGVHAYGTYANHVSNSGSRINDAVFDLLHGWIQGNE